MIRIHKTGNIPAILLTDGIQNRDQLAADFAANGAAFTSASGVSNRTLSKMDIDNKIYGDSTVKAQLIREQHDKCCFCEAKFSENSYGDVEHFRPKKAYKKRRARILTYPGYYWLGYDWSNLMFSCEKCNRKYKRNDFPLDDETTRVANHTQAGNLNNEDRLLIDPINEDPDRFIVFDDEVPLPRNSSLKGKTSIDVYGLERMNNERLEYLVLLDGLLPYCNVDPTDNQQIQLVMDALHIPRQEVLAKIANAHHFYISAAKDSGKFAYCVRSKFPHLPIV